MAGHAAVDLLDVGVSLSLGLASERRRKTGPLRPEVDKGLDLDRCVQATACEGLVLEPLGGGFAAGKVDSYQAANFGPAIITDQSAGESDPVSDLRDVGAVLSLQLPSQVLRVGFVQKNECVNHGNNPKTPRMTDVVATSVRLGQSEHFLSDEAQDELWADGC